MRDREPVTLTTGRVVLRPPVAGDFGAWAAFMADAETMRFLGGRQPPEAACRGFLSVAGGWAIQGFGTLAVIERETGDWVGRLGPWQPLGWPGPEIGWGIARSRWGRGYAVEGAAAAIDWAVGHLGWEEIVDCIEEGHTASERAAEKLGSARLRAARSPPPTEAEVVVWGQSADEWRRHRHG